MEKLTVSTLSRGGLKQFVKLEERGIQDYDWLDIREAETDESERQQLNHIQLKLLNYSTHLMNEATIWARGIYPILLLAEQSWVQAWSQVNLTAKYLQFEIECVADGVLGKCVSGFIEAPYLVVVEAKRGLESQNPLYQLYGELLAAGWMNWQENQQEKQEIFGCYTIADTWTFIRAEIADIEAEMPTLKIESSREYSAKLEAEIILQILKKIVSRYTT
ncbi:MULTISPECIES: hypothetical protein [Spirulina sp. CCY15215]|uniref:hypothetical protein n=1 Tax=Spirulina sp. CCY15215 TaxID=2767591 RepID=UPI00194E32AB